MHGDDDTMRSHHYRAHLAWEGNLGEGTARYAGYTRSFRVRAEGKPDLLGSAHAGFRGDAARHDPEDLFLAAIAGCHMLAYLALCARRGVVVVSYEDEATGTLELDPAGGGRFSEVTLHPVVAIAEESDEALALELHDAAHERCFIASSVSVPVHHRATVHRAAATAATVAVPGEGAP
jgi:organic hydroperoxide reductase OsmC/OhrA